jgi:alkylation response protein AidB-like acyl-CoA dehydrogenase
VTPSAPPSERELVDALTELCRRYVPPAYMKRCDDEERYPAEAMERLAEAGWAGLAVAEQHGGSRGSATELALVHRTLARYGLAVAQAYYSLWVLGAEAIGRLGTAAQRAQWLPRLARGDAKIAFALTEPDSGSDAASLRTCAVRTGDGFLVNGQKVFVTGAAVADAIVTAVRTSTAADRHEGLSLLLLDPRAPGVTVRPLSKLGLKALDLCELFLADVEVPADRLLGPLDQGWASLRPGFALERTLLAAICVGGTEDVLEAATRHAAERVAFGQPIGRFQLVADKLVGIRVGVEAASLLVARAAAAIDAGAGAEVEAAIAKLYAAEAYVSAAREGVQVFGGYGFTSDYPVSRHYRDAKFMEIGGGTSEIQKVIIARSMGLL